VSQTEPVRHFTVDEANDLLASLAPLIESLRSAQRLMEDRQEDVLTSVVTNGGGTVHREFLAAASQAAKIGETVEQMGVIVRDPESGLADFPALRDGKEVFLCWRLGEDRIGWWHPTDTGFDSRQPL